MSHVPRHDRLLPPLTQRSQILVQIRVCETRDLLFRNHLLPSKGFEFVEFLGQCRAGSEDGGPRGGLVNDVHNVFAVTAGAVFCEEGRDGFACVLHVDGFERADGVSVFFKVGIGSVL